MKNITDMLLKYLDAKQHIWNSYFLGQIKDIRECQPLESFQVIDEQLFFALVCHPLMIKLPPSHAFGKDPISQIALKPKKEMADIPLMVSKPSTDGNRYWGSADILSTSNLTLYFIEFFHWDKYSFLAGSLVRCRLECSDIGTSRAGRDALVDLRYVNFYFIKQRIDRRSAARAEQT